MADFQCSLRCAGGLVRRLRLLTGGESHGPGLTAILEGLPAGLELDRQQIDACLQRRQHGFGRGGRQKIEKDEVRGDRGPARRPHPRRPPGALGVEQRLGELDGGHGPVGSGSRSGGETRRHPSASRPRRLLGRGRHRPVRGHAQRARAVIGPGNCGPGRGGSRLCPAARPLRRCHAVRGAPRRAGGGPGGAPVVGGPGNGAARLAPGHPEAGRRGTAGRGCSRGARRRRDDGRSGWRRWCAACRRVSGPTLTGTKSSTED